MLINLIVGIVLFISAIIYFMFIKVDLTSNFGSRLKSLLYLMGYYILINLSIIFLVKDSIRFDFGFGIQFLLYVTLFVANNLISRKLRKIRNKQKNKIIQESI